MKRIIRDHIKHVHDLHTEYSKQNIEDLITKMANDMISFVNWKGHFNDNELLKITISVENYQVVVEAQDEASS